MKLYKKKQSLKEEVKQQQKLKLVLQHKISIRRWISIIAYPFFILMPFQNVSGQTTSLDFIYEQILNLDFEASRKLVDQNENNLFPYSKLYLHNLNDVLELVFTEDKNKFEVLKNNEEARLKELNKINHSDPYVGFLEAEIKLHWSFVKLKFNNTLSGVWGLRQAYKTIRDNIEAHPNFKLNYKTLGLLHVIFGAVPENQQWVLSILGLEGDVFLGLNELTEVAKQGGVFQTETNLITALIQSYLMEDHKSALVKLKSASKEPTSTQTYVTALTLMKAHKALEAKRILQDCISSSKLSEETLPLFYYLLAESQFQAGSYSEAKTNYSLFLNNFKGSSQKKDAYMKVAMCEFYLGNILAFNTRWQEAKDVKSSEAEADRNAGKILDNETLPNFELLRIRFALDGGFYSLASSLIDQIDKDNIQLYEQFELDYRVARYAHLTEQYDRALEGYKKVIDNSQNLPETYFVPNSFLQIAYLKLEQGDTTEAIMYFNEVIQFKKHPYKSSLDSKAKIALKAIDVSGG